MTLLLALADALGFVGVAGAVLAVASALTAAVAFTVTETPTVGKIATVIWLGGALLSLCSWCSGAWVLPAVAVAAPLAFWILTGAFRMLAEK